MHATNTRRRPVLRLRAADVLAVACAGNLLEAIQRGDLRRNGDCRIGHVLDLVLQGLEANLALHSQRVVWCDAKPENILLDEGQVLLADFGTTHRLPEGCELVTECTPITPRWAAPELSRIGEISKQADVWSWGRIGQAAFNGEVFADTEGCAPTVFVSHVHVQACSLAQILRSASGG